jgi:hypothetical protein
MTPQSFQELIIHTCLHPAEERDTLLPRLARPQDMEACQHKCIRRSLLNTAWGTKQIREDVNGENTLFFTDCGMQAIGSKRSLAGSRSFGWQVRNSSKMVMLAESRASL